jgi:alpha,alpha-trehalase
MDIARKEYEDVWQGGQRANHQTGLNQYQPRFLRKLLTVYESGWDVSTRFAFGRTSLIPVDLNCLLYKYESDLLRWADQQGDKPAAKVWRARMDKRRKAIDTYLWDEERGFYFDYDLKTETREQLMTLAGYYALWSGVAAPAQAERCRQQLKVFERKHGLANTEKLPWHHRQWDYPNGWPPQQLLTFEGLRRYGFTDDARRIGRKYLDLNARMLTQTGQLWEKYDVVRGRIGWRGRYPTQPGFAWTNSTFLRIQRHLEE